MITITVELLSGVLRANSGEAITGSRDNDAAEWPPSPARLFAALVAGGGTQDNNAIDSDDSELRLLESAPPPLIAAAPESGVCRSILRDRFVVIDKRENKVDRVQEYPARKAGTVRPGQRVSPYSPYITYVWPEIEPTETEMTALRRRAARVPYFGCADSPVRISVNRSTPKDDRAIWHPDDDGITSIAVPYVGYLAALDRSFTAFRAGASPRASRLPRRRVAYRPPASDHTEGPTRDGSVLWLVLDEAVSARRALDVGNALRGLTLSAYDEMFGDPPVVLHGHGVGRGEQHARFLPLADVGFRYSKGRIHGAAIWLPPGSDPVLGNLRVAIQGSKRTLNLPGGTQRGIRLRSDRDRRPWACHPDRWSQPATTLATVFPAVHQRFGTIDDPLAIVSGWCRDAGLPQPIEVEMGRPSFFVGIPRFASSEVWREKSTRGYPYSHLKVTFAEPVVGPVAIGRGRSFGLGLLAPYPPAGSDGIEGTNSAGGAADE